MAGPIGQLQQGLPVGYGFTAIIVAFLGRLNPFGILLAGAVMALTLSAARPRSSCCRIPAAAISVYQGMLLFFLLALDILTRYRDRGVVAGDRLMDFSSISLVALVSGLVFAATPLLFAAIGELVVEKSGVLNLGVEGMMMMGAVTGFAIAVGTGTPALGFSPGRWRGRCWRCSSGC